MFVLDRLVPGFDRTLDATPGARHAWRVLQDNVARSALGERVSALVHVSVASHAGGDYARWAMGRQAARQGLSGEDILLASAGTAIDGREAVIVKAARRMAAQARLADTEAYRALESLIGPEPAVQVLSHVALALLACDVLDRVTPGTTTAAKGA